jgi:hypothetical protein
MTAALFALPFGRCLSPSPYPEKPAFKKGDWVVWLPDSEEGVVVAVSESSLCVEWEEYGICWYPLHSIAATERIAVIKPEAFV